MAMCMILSVKGRYVHCGTGSSEAVLVMKKWKIILGSAAAALGAAIVIANSPLIV